MSDAACGPSNSLQQFKQQTQVDRTLQQDRLTARQHPAQGFRSVDPNAGLLDPEFEAFQAGLPPPDFQPFHQQNPTPEAFQQAFPQPSQGPSWASDFQRMSLASPPPMQQQQHQQNQARQALIDQLPAHLKVQMQARHQEARHQHTGISSSDWAQDFRTNVSQAAPRAQNSSPSPFAFQQRARYGMGGFQSNIAQPAFSPAMQSKGKEPMTEQFDEAAFERAFDMAKEDMMVDATPASAVENMQAESQTAADMSKESHQLHQNEVLQNLNDPHRPLDMQDRLLPEEIVRERQQEPQQSTRESDDALAATAQELLEKVENNQTDKFKNSQFLSLMRKLRDREVKVEGDKMVETVSASQIQPKRTLTPDSGYDSGFNTPLPDTTTTSAPHNPTLCKVAECDVVQDHLWDHWESPYT